MSDKPLFPEAAFEAGAQELNAAASAMLERYGMPMGALAINMATARNLLTLLEHHGVSPIDIALVNRCFQSFTAGWAAAAGIDTAELKRAAEGMLEHMHIIEADLAEAAETQGERKDHG